MTAINGDRQQAEDTVRGAQPDAASDIGDDRSLHAAPSFAEREEEQRYWRNVQAARLVGGDVQGGLPSDAIYVTSANETAPGQDGLDRGGSSLKSGSASDDEGSDDGLAVKKAGGVLPEIVEEEGAADAEPLGTPEAGRTNKQEDAATAAAAPNSASARSPSASLGAAPGGEVLSLRAASVGSRTSESIGDMVGRPLPPGGELIIPSGLGHKDRAGSGTVPKQNEILASLDASQQMTMGFHCISSWVKIQDFSASKPLGDLLSGPAKLARAVARQAKKPAGKKQGDVEMGEGGGKAGGGHARAPGVATSLAIDGHRQILYAITGSVKPGEVLALMGPSGSGKTSLLSALGGRTPPTIKLDGSITINGASMTKTTRKRIGFVLQDDVLYESLTVRETLEYAGMLRLPRDMSREEKMARVDAVIAVLGLTKSRDTIIGGYFQRGVSGGERKRVSVGHELLINPAVLLLDEPTSGLDSTTALHLVTLLRDLASGGRAILTTIHQPSSRLYQQLDKVMLLAEGHMMYYGDALRAADWFTHLGYGLPYGTNLADHILDCAMGEAAHDSTAPGAGCGKDHRQGASAIRACYQTWEQFYAAHPEGFVVPFGAVNGPRLSFSGSSKLPSGGMGTLAMTRQASADVVAGLLHDVRLGPGSRRSSLSYATKPGAAHAAMGAAAPAGNGKPVSTSGATGDATQASGPVTVVVDKPGPQQQEAARSSSDDVAVVTTDSTRNGAPYLTQIAVLWRRAVNVRRFESLNANNVFQLAAVGVITGLLWWQRGQNKTIAGAADVLGLIFFEMVFVSFRSLFSALFTLPNEYRMLKKERPSGMYQLSAYYAARTAADAPLEMLLPTLYVIIVYWFGGLRREAGAFFANLAAVLLVVLVAQSWGLLVGGVFMDPKKAQSVTTVVMLSFMLVGGYYVRDVPNWIGWIKYLSFIYWGNNFLLKIEYRGVTREDCRQPDPVTGNCLVVTDLKSALTLPIDPNDSTWPEAVVLLGMLAFLRVVTFYVLGWKTSTKQKMN